MHCAFIRDRPVVDYQLTGFIPIAALPESTAASAKQQLIETIEWLHKEGNVTH